MGMYTAILVDVDLISDTPDNVIELIERVCEKDLRWMNEKGYPTRWGMLFNNGSFYTTNTSCAVLNKELGHYSLLGKGDIKDYENEIEEFFKFIAPWSKEDFLGYSIYEEDDKPTLFFKSQFVGA